MLLSRKARNTVPVSARLPGRGAVATTLAVLVAVAACAGNAHPAPRTRLSPKEIVERSKPAIVRVESTYEGGGGGVGTGFAVRKDGLIATNLHVVTGASTIKVILLDQSEHAVESVLGWDADRDLALIRIAVPKEGMPTLTIGDSDAVSAGDPVLAIGNPLGVLDYTVSDGLISSVRAVSPALTVLQISAPISQGSSGGPLFNPYGEVIGIATAIFTEGQNLNFGVPSKYLRALIDAAKPMTVAEFNELTRPQPAPGDAPRAPRIQRHVPIHEVGVLTGCSDESLVAVFQAINETVTIGAPLYNEGNHEACYRVYEGTAMKLEREGDCEGVRNAFGNGLLRAQTVRSYTEKAWALRDAFDGLLLVIAKKIQGP